MTDTNLTEIFTPEEQAALADNPHFQRLGGVVEAAGEDADDSEAEDAHEATDEEEQAEVAEGDDETEEEAGASEEGDEEGVEEEAEEETAEQKSVKYFKEQARANDRRAMEWEVKYQQLLEGVQKMMGDGKQEAAADDDVLDEIGFKKTNDRISEIEAKQERRAFQYALSAEESAGRAAHPDFDAAFQHYANIVRESIIDSDPSIGEEQAQAIAAQQLQRALYQRFQRGLPIAEWVYKQSSRLGYKPAAPTEQKADKKTKVDTDAINRNKKRTSKPDAERASFDTPEDPQDVLRALAKHTKGNAGVDREYLRKLLKQHSA